MERRGTRVALSVWAVLVVLFLWVPLVLICVYAFNSSNIQSWQKRGMVGLVTGGGLADTDEIIHQKIPVYFRRLARGIRPGRNELESVNRPVTVGGVLVRPGDVVMADGDGVVVVPKNAVIPAGFWI